MVLFTEHIILQLWSSAVCHLLICIDSISALKVDLIISYLLSLSAINMCGGLKLDSQYANLITALLNVFQSKVLFCSSF